MPTRGNRGFYCRFYCTLNMFRALLSPSSGAQEYYSVVAACGIWCCGFQVVGLVWSWGLCVRFAGCCQAASCKPILHSRLKSEKSNGCLTWRLCTFMIIFRWILLRQRSVSDKICWELQNTHFAYHNFLFRKPCLLWDKMENYGGIRQATFDNIIGRMRIACWMTKAGLKNT